jgi:hypothetical protein
MVAFEVFYMVMIHPIVHIQCTVGPEYRRTGIDPPVSLIMPIHLRR